MHYVKLNPGEVNLAFLHRETRRVERAIDFALREGLDHLTVTTRTGQAERILKGLGVMFIPSALFYYMIGARVIRGEK